MYIVHVASVEISPNSGMGRIAFEWKKAFEKEGHRFTHIGWKEIKKKSHPLLFGWQVRRFIVKNKIKPDVILSHEPAAGFLVFKNIPLVIFSHGIEERNWNLQKTYQYSHTSVKAKLIPLIIRFWSNNYGFKHASKIFLSNNTDKDYLIQNKSINPKLIEVFKNGYLDFSIVRNMNGDRIGFLYNASWIERKGNKLLISAFNLLLLKYKFVQLYIAGTDLAECKILDQFLYEVRSQIIILPPFSSHTESVIYSNASVFVLPSYFEGQSLALTQAMHMGLCPVVSDNCGQLDLIQNNINGLHFKTGDINSLVEKLEILIRDSLLIEKYGKAAKKSVGFLQWSYVSNQIVNSVKSIL